MTEEYHIFPIGLTAKKITSVYAPTELIDQIFALSFAW